jgi:signal transduction histidine kinase
LMESKRQFVRFVSHEVRTPLNTVCMGLSLMQDDFAKCLGIRHGHGGGGKGGGNSGSTSMPSSSDPAYASEQVEDWMQLSTQMQRNAEAAVSVLNDLLNYDKIQSGTLTLELSLIPIWTIVQKTVAEFQISSLEKKVKLSVDFSPMMDGEDDEEHHTKMYHHSMKCLPAEKRGYKIVGDNIRIAQVLRNLISNGLKFSQENGTCILYYMTDSISLTWNIQFFPRANIFLLLTHSFLSV